MHLHWAFHTRALDTFRALSAGIWGAAYTPPGYTDSASGSMRAAASDAGFCSQDISEGSEDLP